MTLSEHAGAVAFGPQHISQGQCARFEITGSAGALEGAAAPAGGSDYLLSGKESVTRRRTDSGGTVRICKHDAFSGHFVNARSFVSCLRVVNGDIPEAQIICINNYDVGQFRSGAPRR